MPDGFNGIVPREVHLNRRDRGATVSGCMKVGPRSRILLRSGRTNPIDGPTPRIGITNHRFGLMAPAQSRRLNALQGLPRHVRHVHVEDRIRRQRRLAQALDKFDGHSGSGFEVFRTVTGQGDRNRGKPEKTPFHGSGDGSGIEDVVPHVGPGVYPRDHHVGLFVEKACHRKVNTIRRSTIDPNHVRLHRNRSQRPLQCQRITGPTAVPFGGYNRDVPQMLKGVRQTAQAWRLIAIIIADENLHSLLTYASLKDAYYTRTEGRKQPDKGRGRIGVQKDQVMANKFRVTKEEQALFRETVRDVVPLRNDRVLPHRQRPRPRPLQRERDETEVIRDLLSDPLDPADLETGDELLFARPGLQHTVFRKLRRGQYSVGAELDLHGLTSAEARQAIVEFLAECRRCDIRCVRIIHGKGNGSMNREPILKGKVAHWLRQREEVLAYASARPVDGGTGAIYVLLRRAR